MPRPTDAPPVVPIDFTRDNRWFAQLHQGDILTEEDMTLLWKDLVACYELAQTFEAILTAADMRIATLKAENERLTAALAAALHGA
jgi:hypothetical protein